jgi:hypothetical protein
VRAYKFLDAELRSPFTLTPWEPGVWVETASARACHEGVHACAAADLAWWLAPALWEVELDEPVVVTRRKLVARRGRLVAPVEGYPAAVIELGETAAWRARDLAVAALRAAGSAELAEGFAVATTLEGLRRLGDRVDDTTVAGRAAGLAADAADLAIAGRPVTEAPFVGAYAAGHDAAGSTGDQSRFDEAYAHERAWQSAWLARRLGLDGH